jgi:hypothetical protein
MQSAARTSAQRLVLRLVSTSLLLVLAACDRAVDEPRTGSYRATLQLPGGEMPFGLEVAEENKRFVLYLVNAAERTRVNNVTLARSEEHTNVESRMPSSA